MKKIHHISFTLLCILLFACSKSHGVTEKEYYVFSSFHEPAIDGLRYLYSEDGIHWDSIPGVWLKGSVGKQQIMRDPSIVKTPDGTFHLVWTSSWKGDRGFGYAHSKDLMNWSEQQFIPVMQEDSTTVNTWAPELFYDDVNDEFIVVWASCIPGRFERGIEDEDNNQRLFYLTTKDFRTVSSTKLLYDPGFSSIDAVIVKRAEKDYVLVFKDNTRPNRNLKVAFAESPTGPYSQASEAFTGSFTEGPSVVKLGDEYFIYYDDYKKYIYGAVKTKDFISFTDETTTVSVPPLHKHGTIFKASESIVRQLLNTKH